MSTETARSPHGFTHEALLYTSERDYFNRLVPFIAAAAAAGEPVFAAVPTHRLDLLHRAISGSGVRIETADMQEIGRNPGSLISTYHAFSAEHPGTPLRMVGEVLWPGRSAGEQLAVAQHEALCNLAFAEQPVTSLCPYDAANLEATALAHVRATHPTLCEEGETRVSHEYNPDLVLDTYTQPLPTPRHVETFTVCTIDDLRAARRFVTVQARRFSTDERVEDLRLIADELATNGITHAGSPCTVAVWQENGHVVCSVRDTGQLTDPLAGRRLPESKASGGRGLLLTHRLADLVRIHAGPWGTTVQVHIPAV